MTMKKMKSFSGKLQNVSLLYFLFIATLVHLGYFALQAETQSLVIFSLAFLFVYLIEKNMVIVLGISLVFTDLLYIIQRMPEGFTNKDCSLNDPSCNEVNDASGNKETMKNQKKEKKNTKDRKSNTERMTNREGMDTESVNPLIQAKYIMGQDTSETVTDEKDAFTGSELETVQQDSKQMKYVLDKIKQNPDIVDSIKTLNGIDIHELNKLINNLNAAVDSFNKLD